MKKIAFSLNGLLSLEELFVTKIILEAIWLWHPSGTRKVIDILSEN